MSEKSSAESTDLTDLSDQYCEDQDCEVEIDLNFSKIQGIYDKARFVFMTLGKFDKDGNAQLHGERLSIMGTRKNPMLSVYFKKEKTQEVGICCLIVDSSGTVRHYDEPHLSEKEAGEGNSDTSYLPWHNWLTRAYRKCKEREAILNSSDSSTGEKIITHE